jgi:holo-[acyl-carrier protein] synthase
MIIGMGIDLAEVERYRFEDDARAWFARKIYTDEEMAYAMRKRHWAERLAGFYAAKEAVRKAFGHAIPWREIADLLERRGVRAIHLTITHTATMAAAVVVLEG